MEEEGGQSPPGGGIEETCSQGNIFLKTHFDKFCFSQRGRQILKGGYGEMVISF